MKKLLALATLASSIVLFSCEAPRTEPPVQGCQNLEARKANPLPLGGTVFGTYLVDGKHYRNPAKEGAPDPFELGSLSLGVPFASIKRLTHNTVNEAEVAVSPDGSRIVWVERELRNDYDHGNAIYVANRDGTQKRLVVKAVRYLGIPTFAGDHRVMYSDQGPNDPVTLLKFFDLRTGLTSTFQTAFPGSISDPQLSPDGKKLVFKSFEQSNPRVAQLWLMNADGTNWRRLTWTEDKDEDPAFSPDGRTVAFERMFGATDHHASDPNDWFFQEGIISLDLATGRETMLTELDPCGKNELWLPTWSPDGSLLMMTRGLHLENGDFTHDLWVMRKDGSDLQRVPGSGGISFFDWAKY